MMAQAPTNEGPLTQSHLFYLLEITSAKKRVGADRAASEETRSCQDHILRKPPGEPTGLRKNDYLSFHTQAIVQSTDIGINPGLSERDSEASYSRRRLREPRAVLGSSLEKARVHTIGRGIEHAVACPVRVDGYVGGRRNQILRLGPEGDCVRRGRIFVGPFHCVARTNRDSRIAEAHHRERVRAGTCGYYLATTNGHAILRMLVLRLGGVSIGQQRSAFRSVPNDRRTLGRAAGFGTDREHAQCPSCPRG